MKIAVDVDDVLAEFVPALAEWHNDKFGTNLTKDDFHTFAFNEILGGTIPEAIQKVRDFLGSGIIKEMSIVDGAVKALEKSKNKGHKFYAVTSRFPEFQNETNDWLNKNFPNVFEEVHFGHNKYSRHKNSLSKAEQCKALGVEFLIDDLPEHAMECAEKGINVLLLDNPWNRDFKEDDDMVKRVYSWDKIIAEINLFEGCKGK